METKIIAQNMEVQFHPRIRDIDPAIWNGIAGTGYPFLRHEFLAALEQSNSVGIEAGWEPRHVLVEDDGVAVALMPLYIKHNSYGEYVFDWAWADAYQRHGIEYYPKLLTAIPYTPATGPRLCIAAGANANAQAIATAVFEHIRSYAEQLGCSSWHLLFPEQRDMPHFDGLPLGERLGCQYHWFNRDYHDFDEFLGRFVSRKRKNIKRERRRVAEQGITLSRIAGPDIEAADMEVFYDFYQATYLKRGRQGYLTPDFFFQLRETMAEQLLLVMAYRENKPIAAALCLVGDDTLYGRYWGCFEDYECLHFEACYYQGIEYCIEQGLARFDPGAQGEHKILRGFEPIETYSLHWIKHPGFRAAIEDFLNREQAGMQDYKAEAATLLPFRKDTAD